MERLLPLYKTATWLSCATRFTLITLLVICGGLSGIRAQCPYNIDFETGTFAGWTCYTGFVAAVGTDNVISLTPSGPVSGRHTMCSANPGDGLDPYGGFPVNCPNGSGHSIRLGNDQGGGEAEGISYDFVIPASQNIYSLIYNYAVVFQDPNHLEFQQPRMEIQILNVTDNTVISCASVAFHPYGSILPGFFESPTPGDTPVWCKDWSAVSINLNGNAGKTIRIFFKTADCTFKKHFGYAYLDVNSECSGEFVGATYCPDDTAVHVVAPYGYQQYTWYNSSFTQMLGTEQTLTLKPPPPSGTTLAVELVPYSGYGCLDTLFAKLEDTLTVKAMAGPNVFACNHTGVQIGVLPKPGLVYSWSPAVGLSNPGISNPIANPAGPTDYILTANSSGGGCIDHDTVTVGTSVIDNTLQLLGKATYCVGSGDSSILRVQPTDSIQWYKNSIPITGAIKTDYRVLQSGSYYAMLYNSKGCSISTISQDILIDKPKPASRYDLQYAVIDIPITLQARPFGDTILWSPGTFLDTRTSYTPVFKGSYDVLYTINIKTATGCVTIDTQLVKTISHVQVYVPSAFTPNNDGLNDYLHPTLIGIKELHYFRVYNRWGQLVYESRTEKPGWNGMINGAPQATSVYVWMMEGTGVDGNIYRQKGTCTLIR